MGERGRAGWEGMSDGEGEPRVPAVRRADNPNTPLASATSVSAIRPPRPTHAIRRFRLLTSVRTSTTAMGSWGHLSASRRLIASANSSRTTGFTR
jgi:hypothetical protein